jgi:sugar phosphate isomerase/epimerase
MMKTLLVWVACVMVWATGPVSAAAKAGVGTSKQFKGPVGLQLYSLRDSFQKDVPGTLDKVKALGFEYVELAGTYGMSNAAFLEELSKRGLRPVAGHFGYELWRDDPEEAVRQAKALGLKYAGCAWIPHQRPFDERECREAAVVFNRAGAAARKQGIRFFYHNHGYEFQPHGDGTLFDLLMRETDPKLVGYQMDLLWTVHPGQDPVQLLKKYGKRWELMHLKDLRRGVEGDLSGGTDTRNDVTLGTGQVDFPAVLKAARKAGVKYYFIEDESPDVLDQIPLSLRYLSQVGW